jgi:hypothetical protein
MRNRLALFALYCVAASAQAPRDEPFFTVILTGVRMPDPILSALQRETQAAVQPAGVRLYWRSQGVQNGEVPGQVAIIQARGHCTSTGPIRGIAANPASGVEPLGQTHMVNGEVLPFADLQCDAVHRLVDRNLRGLSASQREQLLGRALGRVVAHELYHILLRTQDHGHSGLGRPEQSSADLLAPTDSFSENEARRLGESIGPDSRAASR